jgi:hypothetical protein
MIFLSYQCLRSRFGTNSSVGLFYKGYRSFRIIRRRMGSMVKSLLKVGGQSSGRMTSSNTKVRGVGGRFAAGGAPSTNGAAGGSLRLRSVTLEDRYA